MAEKYFRKKEEIERRIVVRKKKLSAKCIASKPTASKSKLVVPKPDKESKNNPLVKFEDELFPIQKADYSPTECVNCRISYVVFVLGHHQKLATNYLKHELALPKENKVLAI